jgi:signal transduction histidine kinase/ActR/RegA family two-component response regulator
MNALFSKNNARRLIQMGLLFLAYALTAKVGLGLSAVNHFATLIWPPSGIALACLLLYGYELWPAVMLAAFLINLSLGAPPPVALGIAAGNTLQPLAGAYFLREYIGFNPMFSRLQDSFGFILTAFLTTLIASTVGSISLYIGGDLTSATFTQTWTAWWVGDSLGILIVGAFAVRWLYRPLFHKTSRELIEGVILFSSLVIISALIFWTPLSSIGNLPLVYILFIPLIWAALRTGPRGITFALLLTSAVAIASLYYNGSILPLVGGNNELFLLQIFIGTIAVIFLLFTSIVEERKEAVVALRDHIHKLEEALQQIRTQDEAKNDFIATLGHELRNPLSPIISSAELMAQDSAQPVDQKLVDVIHSHARMMARLLDDLLDVSRITRKKFVLQKEVVELQAVVRHSCETVQAFIKNNGHTLTIAMPETPIVLSADPVRLEQIFTNLLFNAAKYTEAGGHISLTIAPEHHTLHISIKDTGVGIEKDMLSRIFEPFVQVHTPKDRVGSGLGIGLSLTKRLVELHGGTIRAESDGQGKGSGFFIDLPLPQHIQLPLLNTANPIHRQLNKNILPAHPKILVVDDNEAAAQGLGLLLEHAGHKVQLAYDGPNALRMIKEFLPHVVLLDIGLPGMDGYEVAKKIREDRDSSLILIALSGYGQDEDKKKAQQSGFNHHLTKPVGIHEVQKVLSNISMQPHVALATS